MSFRTLIVALSLALVAGAGVAATDQARHERAFQKWLTGSIWPLARSEGISRSQFDAATGDLTLDWDLPGVDLPGANPGKQSEFSAPGRYFRQDNLEGIARIGRIQADRHRKTLARIERDTGVSANILLAIWGRESGFGNVGTGHNAFEVLATRAFFGPNKDYFEGELVAALQIADGDNHLSSSWAGALGQPQMMPTSYLAYGADGDGDGRIDIWGSEADTLASIARFLADHDWVRGRDWGFEVRLPREVSCALEGPDQGRKIRNWADMGITRVSGRPFPVHERDQIGFLLTPAGRQGPAFIVTPNFHVLKNYNRSDLYALFVGNAADRIGFGMGDFKAGWAKVNGLGRGDVKLVQKSLQRAGHDVGKPDGIAGFKTRRAIGQWQADNGQPVTCFPATALKDALN